MLATDNPNSAETAQNIFNFLEWFKKKKDLYPRMALNSLVAENILTSRDIF